MHDAPVSLRIANNTLYNRGHSCYPQHMNMDRNAATTMEFNFHVSQSLTCVQKQISEKLVICCFIWGCSYVLCLSAVITTTGDKCCRHFDLFRNKLHDLYGHICNVPALFSRFCGNPSLKTLIL